MTTPTFSTPMAPFGANPSGIGNPFTEHHGMMWEYVRDPEGFDGYAYDATSFASITAKLREGWYNDRGIHHLAIYGPWKSTRAFLGLPPLDYFAGQVGSGSIEDFAAMAAAAAERGITIIIYIELIYIDPANPLFVKAAADREKGVDSTESRLFRWDDREGPQDSCPPDAGLPKALSWTRHPSIAGGRCYAQAWGELGGTLPIGYPAFDFERPEAMEYAQRVMRFWMDLGVQGFVFDAPHTYLGMQGDNEWRQRVLQIETALNHVYPDGRTRPQFLEAEGEGGTIRSAAYSDRIGYNALSVDLGGDVSTLPSRAAGPDASITIDELDAHYRAWVDPRRLAGRGSTGGVVFADGMSPELRALDLAVQTGGVGLMVPLHEQTLQARLDARSRELTFDVLRLVAKSSALAPGASRQRLPSDQPQSYAVLRTSMDGTRSALGVFNFAAEPRIVSVDLASFPGLDGTPRDLATGNAIAVVESHVTIDLPAYGYAFLELPVVEAPAWRIVTANEAGWTVGGGWTLVDDPSTFAGSRIGGNRAGAFAEFTFTGTAVEGWGRLAPRGGDRVQISIDGKVVGTHSQRGTAPLGVPSAFTGNRLFAVEGLSAGPHAIQIEQLNGPAGRNSDGTGLEYLRVLP
ncbi:MAG TPA: hypothetical protein VG757_05105 [Devosia sp.]|nr:hypothetical protein [Devosia sp.]